MLDEWYMSVLIKSAKELKEGEVISEKELEAITKKIVYMYGKQYETL